MWNRPGQSEQEAIGPSSQGQPHPSHGSAHPPQPMQPAAQDKSSTSGKTETDGKCKMKANFIACVSRNPGYGEL